MICARIGRYGDFNAAAIIRASRWRRLIARAFFFKRKKNVLVISRSEARRDETDLILILASAVGVRGFALFIGLEEGDLSYAFVGVNAYRQVGRVRKFEHQPSSPARFERSCIHDQTRTRVSRIVNNEVISNKIVCRWNRQVIYRFFAD